MHILGLWLPQEPVKLITAMDELMRRRHERNVIIVEKLQSAGCDVSYEEVREIAGEGSVGRPHIASVLLRRGYVKSMQEAFDVYLGSRGKAYAPKVVLNADEALPLLKEYGATVLMAHPFQNGFGLELLEKVLRELMEFGLDGLEAYYSEHSPSQTSHCLALSRKLDLAVSGGSDFHGAPKPKISLARGRGDLNIPYAVLDALKERRAKQGLSLPVWTR
jgi:predicted metal-dependent phosphoesterase TrpH